MNKCLMILSDKSSGSSILMQELAKTPGINKIQPDKFHDESKFWMYASAILYPKTQPKMRYSHEFPISKTKATEAISNLLDKLKINYQLKSGPNKEVLFRCWIKICEKLQPVFLEKSPHYIHSKSALELIYEFHKENPDINMKFIALIRNPMDTLYSMWKRWYAIPEIRQFEWLRAYNNLEYFINKNRKHCFFVKYENLIDKPYKTFQEIYDFLELDIINIPELDFNDNSVNKWRNDKIFGFNLDSKVYAFANKYYHKDILKNKESTLWTINKLLNFYAFDWMILETKLKKSIKNRLGL